MSTTGVRASDSYARPPALPTTVDPACADVVVEPASADADVVKPASVDGVVTESAVKPAGVDADVVGPAYTDAGASNTSVEQVGAEAVPPISVEPSGTGASVAVDTFEDLCLKRIARLEGAARQGNCSVAVDTFEDLWMWGIDYVFREQASNLNLKDILAAWVHETCTLSTAYSGIGAPETACAMLSHQLRIFWPDFPEGDLMVPKAMCEIDPDCIDELLARPHCNSCVFGDINKFWHPKTAATVSKAWACPSSSWDMLGPAVKAGKAVVGEAWCYRHRRVCTYPSCTVHVAGSSCTNHSAMGDGISVDGHTSIPKLAWMGMRRLKREPVVLVENVANFPESMLTEYLGDLYTIRVVKLCASPLWPQRRLRKFILMLLRCLEAKLPICLPSLDSWVREHRRRLRVSWLDLMTADISELAAELAWGKSRSKADRPALACDDPDAFESLLNDSEVGFLHSYRTLHPPSSDHPRLAAYSLQQDPSSGFKMLSVTRCMHTMIKNVGLIWMPDAPPFGSGRWVTPLEALLVQGVSCLCCVCACLIVCLLVCLFGLFVCLFVCLCVCLIVCLFGCLFVCLFVC